LFLLLSLETVNAYQLRQERLSRSILRALSMPQRFNLARKADATQNDA
jgi:hypothetical protein